MFENELKIDEVKELRFRNNVYFGVNAIEKIDDILKALKEKNVSKVVVVSGKNAYKITGAWEVVERALKSNGVQYINFDEVLPNPTTHQVDKATKIAADFGAQAVIAIGGGSAIDAGKSVAILLKNLDKNATELFNYEFSPSEAVPIVAINLTHGTGTEANRFAVVTIPEKDYKPAIAYDCIYPFASIDDPKLMVKLSKEQTIYVSIDAVNHVVEAATSKAASPYTVMLAREVITIVNKYLPMAVKNPEDLQARYYLAYAALLGGVCFDNGLLHYTHALEHPLSAIKHEFTHGLGLAILLPAVIKQIFNAKKETLNYIFDGVVAKSASDVEFSVAVEKWLYEMGVTTKLSDEGFKKDDVEKLVELAHTTPSLGMLLGLAPIDTTRDIVKAIYDESFEFTFK